MTIRPAGPADNDSLCALARRCPQGEAVRFYHERTDAFERCRLHDDAEVLVAEAAGVMVGSVAVARKSMWLAGAWRPCCYVFDLMVDPESRGRGLGRALLDAARQAAPAARLAYAYIVEDNHASRRLLERAGFTAHPRRLLYHLMLPRLVRRRPPRSFVFQQLVPSEIAARIDAILQTRYDFLDRTAGHDALLRLGGASAVLRRHGPKVVVAAPWHVVLLSRVLPFVPRPGQPVPSWSLHHLCGDGRSLQRLLRSAAWAAARAGIEAVAVPLFEDDPHSDLVRRLTLMRWGIELGTTRLYVEGELTDILLGTRRPLLMSGRDG